MSFPMHRAFTLSLFLLSLTAAAPAQDDPRRAVSAQQGGKISALDFEHAFGDGAPEDASSISVESLRGQTVILEFWGTW